jgi:Family of unknown function (DUF6603)
VVTLGGYNPHFDKPNFYPAVPILGANWQVTTELVISGGIYFALTPSCVMAGGYLNAAWHSGNLKAWFSANADFLLSWKPFHYQADISVSLGASYRLNLGFASYTFTVHVGASLDLWGPPFAGVAKVDLDVVSFTIHFGKQNPAIEPIPWSEFKSSFLPDPAASSGGAPSEPRAGAAASGNPIQTDTYCYSQITTGLLKDLTQGQQSADDPDWVISPELFQLTTHSVVPVTLATLITGNNKQTPIAGTYPQNFGVGPVGIANGDLSSQHAVTIQKLTGGQVDPDYDASPGLSIALVTANVPSAPWSKAMSLDLVESPNISAVNSTPSTIAALVVGITLSPAVQPSDSTPAFNIADLQVSTAPTQPEFSWSQPTIASTDPFDQTQAMQSFMSSLTGAAATRSAILQELAGQGVAISAAVDVSDLAAAANQVLLHAPLLSYLGEERSST